MLPFFLSLLFSLLPLFVSSQPTTYVVFSEAQQECSLGVSLIEGSSSISSSPSSCVSSPSPNPHFVGNVGYDNNMGFSYNLESNSYSSYSFRISNFTGGNTIATIPLINMNGNSILSFKTLTSASITTIYMVIAGSPAFSLQKITVNAVNPSSTAQSPTLILDISPFFTLVQLGVMDVDIRDNTVFIAGIANSSTVVAQISGSSVIQIYNLTQASLLGLKVRSGAATPYKQLLLYTSSGVQMYNTQSMAMVSLTFVPNGNIPSTAFLYDTMTDSVVFQSQIPSSVSSNTPSVAINRYTLSSSSSSSFAASIPFANIPEQFLYVPCPPGYYCPSFNTTTPTICPLGSYCPTNSQSPILAQAGYFINQTGFSTPAIFQCQPGSFCPQGSGNPTPCPIGNYCPSFGLSTNGTACNPGNVCPSQGLSSPINCSASYYCPSTTGSPTQFSCPEGAYCPQGSSAIRPCDAGYYCPASSSQEIICENGYYCPSGSLNARLPCPAGSSCGAGPVVNPTVCGLGTYATAGMSSCTSCVNTYETLQVYCPSNTTTANPPCPAGYFCQSSTQEIACNIGGNGNYCPVGSISPKLCSSGETCLNPTQSIPDPCPVGFYCQYPYQAAQPCSTDCASSCTTTGCSADCCHNPSTSSSSTTNAIIGACVSGGFSIISAIIIFFLRQYYAKKAKAEEDKLLNEQGKEHAEWVRAIKPIIEAIFDHVRTSGLLSSRSDRDLRHIMGSIQSILGKIERKGTFSLQSHSITPGDMSIISKCIVDAFALKLCISGWKRFFVADADYHKFDKLASEIVDEAIHSIKTNCSDLAGQSEHSVEEHGQIEAGLGTTREIKKRDKQEEKDEDGKKNGKVHAQGSDGDAQVVEMERLTED